MKHITVWAINFYLIVEYRLWTELFEMNKFWDELSGCSLNVHLIFEKSGIIVGFMQWWVNTILPQKYKEQKQINIMRKMSCIVVEDFSNEIQMMHRITNSSTQNEPIKLNKKFITYINRVKRQTLWCDNKDEDNHY